MGIDYTKWKDHPSNPLIEPPWPSPLLGDPTFLRPDESPDNRWHLFANSLLHLHHYVSKDGIKWDKKGSSIGRGNRAFIFYEDQYYLFYELFTTPLRSVVAVKSSTDLITWTKPKTILKPSLDWEGKIIKTNGNPCLVKHQNKYMLFYSAGLVFLGDLGFCEPKYIGLAHAKNIFGPYKKLDNPIIALDEKSIYRNKGAGAIKVFFDEKEKKFIGFNNGIYQDKEGRSRSAILLMNSTDGVKWEEASENPIIYPTEGWKKALVYQLDVKRLGDELWLYYNARDGWRIGKERIGLAIARKE